MRRWFRALLKLFPSDFRADYGRQMEQDFGDELHDAPDAGARLGVARRNTAAVILLGFRLHVEQVVQDTRYALRAMRRSPAFTAGATTALAVGIGATVSTFAMADAFFFKPLPFAQPGALVHLWAADRARGENELRASLPEFESWQARRDLLVDAAIFNYSSVEMVSAGEPESIPAGHVTANVFELLGVPPLLGRTLQRGDDQPGAQPVVVLSEAFWRARFNGDDAVMGRTIALAGVPHTVVGVMPGSFLFPLPTTRLWIPRTIDRARLTASVQSFQVAARLQPGVTAARVEAALSLDAPPLAAIYPELAGRTVHVESLRQGLNFADDILSMGAIVIGLANLLVLVAACANISSLMLGRAVARGREVAIRTAIGASRFRLVRQFMVESAALATLGAAAGLVVALWAIGVADRLISPEIYRPQAMTLDLRTLAVAAALATGSALLFGLAPALQFARTGVASVLRPTGGAGSSSRRGLLLQSLFVQKQVALSVVLLVGTVLVARSFAALDAVDPGFNADGVVTAQMSLPVERYPDRDARARFHRDVRERVGRIPGVLEAATVDFLPLNHENRFDLVTALGQAPPDAGARAQAQVITVSPGYFAVLETPLGAGRDFDPADSADRPRVAIVNRVFERRYWQDRSAVGESFRLDDRPETYSVIGVVADTRQEDLSRAAPAQVFLAQSQAPKSYLRVVARTVGDPTAFSASVAAAVHDVDPHLPVNQRRTLREIVDEFLLPQRSLRVVLLVLGGFSLWLALFGIYGIVSCYVAERTREIGVRAALGASEARLLGDVVGRGMRLAVIGALVGLVLSALGAWALRGVLTGVETGDPVTYVGVGLLVVTVAIAAGLPAARRAARVSPTVAMRGGD